MIRRLFNRFLRIYQLLNDRKYYHLSYSQEGEDMILRKYFDTKQDGFYIDIGAHHPKRFSNTYFFYNRGWRGINVDAMPGSMKSFNVVRKRDINLEVAISNIEKDLIYYIFDEPAINGFSKEISQDREKNSPYKLIDQIKIKTETLAGILSKCLPLEVKKIDFMSIDVEGLDLEVLKSNNWEKYRPHIILVELLDFESFDNDPIFSFLINKNYKFQAKSQYTFFFIDNQV